MLGMIDFIDDALGTTSHGYDKLDIMIRFLPVLEGENVESNFNRLKSYLVSLLKRGITPQEEINLMEGIVKFVQSDGQTNERLEAMDYLFELKFLV